MRVPPALLIALLVLPAVATFPASAHPGLGFQPTMVQTTLTVTHAAAISPGASTVDVSVAFDVEHGDHDLAELYPTWQVEAVLAGYSWSAHRGQLLPLSPPVVLYQHTHCEDDVPLNLGFEARDGNGDSLGFGALTWTRAGPAAQTADTAGFGGFSRLRFELRVVPFLNNGCAPLITPMPCDLSEVPTVPNLPDLFPGCECPPFTTPNEMGFCEPPCAPYVNDVGCPEPEPTPKPEEDPACEPGQPGLGPRSLEPLWDAFWQVVPVAASPCDGEQWDGQDVIIPDQDPCTTGLHGDPTQPEWGFSYCGGSDPNEPRDFDPSTAFGGRVTFGRDEAYASFGLVGVGTVATHVRLDDGPGGFLAAIYVRDNTPGNVAWTVLSSTALPGGYVSEGDCTYEEFETSRAGGDPTACGRDNTAFGLGGQIP